MGRRSNQVRVVDPEQDRRLHQIGETLIRDGYAAATADILAEGFVGRLRRRVYAALDDVIGSGDDLEALIAEVDAYWLVLNQQPLADE